ncbi:MAG: hypothetical protein ACOCPQ_04510 [Desulfosudaceae bacterium]
MDNLSLYEAAQLVTAAIRIIEFKDQQPPSPEAVAALLSVSTERVLRICRKLERQNAISMVSGGFGEKLFIKDHLAIEKLPHQSDSADMTGELEKFKAVQKDRDQKIEALKQKEEERKKKLFDQIERQFKSGQPNPGNPDQSSDQ